MAQFSTTPVLLVWGMQDPVLSAAVLQRWQQLYPHATMQKLEDASHFLQEDAPERIVQWIEAFMRTNL